MAGFVEWIKAFAISLGGPGLFLIAFLDSSFLSFPEVNDLLIIWLTTQHEERMVYYALMTTLGSISGCLALYFVARKGGEAFLQKRFSPHYLERAMADVPPLRPARHPGPVDPAAADAVQGLRACGWRRASPRVPTSSSRLRSGADSVISAKDFWRSTTATKRPNFCSGMRRQWP